MASKIKLAARRRLVEKWYKKWSVWLVSAAGVIAFLPSDSVVMAYLPHEWYRWAFIAIFLARVIKQKSDDAK